MRPTARRSGPIAHLVGLQGVLQVDGYGGCTTLAGRREVRLACADPAPIAAEALARLTALYRIEG